MDIFEINLEEREKLINSHPIVTKEFVIVTPVINRAYSLIRERVWMRSTGTFLHASQRMGKSVCAKTVEDAIKQENPQIAVMSFSAVKRENRAKTLFIEMLRSLNLDVPKYPRFEVIENKLMTHILTQCLQKKGQQFVLLIDEMQNLCEADYNMLLAIHNRLDNKNIKMTTIGFAQPEILEIRTALLATRSLHLIARFLSEPIPFDGCSTKEDLSFILEAYDEKEFYPLDSHYSFTRFFLPEAFDNGFRLNTYNNAIWKELINARAGPDNISIPMQHLTSTIAYLLLEARKNDSKTYKLNKKIIAESVDRSALKYFSGLLSTFDHTN